MRRRCVWCGRRVRRWSFLRFCFWFWSAFLAVYGVLWVVQEAPYALIGAVVLGLGVLAVRVGR